MNIRKATEVDSEAIKAMHGELTDFHNSIDPIHMVGAFNLDDYRSDIVGKLNDDKFHVTVAEIDGKVVGYFVAHIRNDGLGHVWEMFVLPEHRQKGIGKELYQDGAEWLKGNGVKTVYLYVDTRNEAGLKTWENLGFKEYMKKMKMDL